MSPEVPAIFRAIEDMLLPSANFVILTGHNATLHLNPPTEVWTAVLYIASALNEPRPHWLKHLPYLPVLQQSLRLNYYSTK